ncbi:MAG: hypothetical protein A2521_12245 [Deltaproteobacteria bacterium RIFOXYD12_FULL_57_12]|nr:MAG: hypothetical protein A2521_12245 [Deltaproteobacteria bacterium RIFOXYD12_FULL_57_12]
MFKKLLAMLPLLLAVSCASLLYRERPRISVVDLRLTNATLFEQNYLVVLRIQNPNTADIPIIGLQYELELNDQFFASGVANQPVTVPGLGSAVIEVETTSTLLSIFNQLSALQQETGQDLSYRLKGKIHLANLSSLPFNYSGTISLGSLGPPPPR